MNDFAPKALTAASVSVLEALEPRRLLSGRAELAGDLFIGARNRVEVLVGKDGETAWALDAALAVGPVDVQDLSIRLGSPLKPVSTAVSAAWARATDLSRYSVEELDADVWAVLLPEGASIADLAARLGKPVTESGVIERVAIVDFAGFEGSKLGALRAAGLTTDGAYPLAPQARAPRYTPNDSYYSAQWHLDNTGQYGGLAGADAGASEAWDRIAPNGTRVDGTGVLIGIVDDGVHWDHPDLSPNYNANHSYDFVGNDADPYPGTWDWHGTNVAGVAAARGDNGIGVVGAAFDAEFAALRVLENWMTDINEAAALGYHRDAIDIYSNSWGPYDDGYRFEGPGPLTAAAMELTATTGRGGLGGIITWAGGNGGYFDDSNRDGYANSRYTIAVGAVNNYGLQSSYSENGANLFVAAPSDGGSAGIWTVDGTSSYTPDFGGTSSAAPLVSGIIALMLEANPGLAYRDVQHILANTSERVGVAGSWQTNGGGFDVSHAYGFGRIDAAAAVDAALGWQSVSEEISWSSGTRVVNTSIPDANGVGVVRTIDVPAGIDIEHVEVTVNLLHTYRGDLNITLTSPDGTVSRLLQNKGISGDSNNHISNWTFSSVQHWGESSEGTWTLHVQDMVAGDTGTWQNFTMELFGTPTPALEAPTVVDQSFSFADAHTITMVFDQDVSASLGGEDLLVRDAYTGEAFPVVLEEYDGSTHTARFTFADGEAISIAPDGNLLPSGRYIAELVGEVTGPGGAVTPSVPLEFSYLAGDGNGDGRVDVFDTLLIRLNMNKSPATFHEGDYNYDGRVDVFDSLVIRLNMNQTLPPPPASLFDPGDGESDDAGGGETRSLVGRIL